MYFKAQTIKDWPICAARLCKPKQTMMLAHDIPYQESHLQPDGLAEARHTPACVAAEVLFNNGWPQWQVVGHRVFNS